MDLTEDSGKLSIKLLHPKIGSHSLQEVDTGDPVLLRLTIKHMSNHVFGGLALWAWA